MTILVGIRCTDGVVVGTDSAATFSDGSKRTIEQPVDYKLTIINARIIVAITGEIGMGQRFLNVVRRSADEPDGILAKGRFDATKTLSRLMLADWRESGVSRPLGLGALVAFQSVEGPVLAQYNTTTFQPELKDEGLWFASMGSGQMICDPFLALLRRTLFRDGEQPNVNEGVFLVTWALHQAIELNPGGIGGDMRVAVLTRSGGAQFEELSEHRENVEAAERHLGAYRDMLRRQSADAPAIPRLRK